MSGNDDRWRRADRLFESALDLDPGERIAFVDRECGDDAELRALVLRLLANTETEDSWLAPGDGLSATALESLGGGPGDESDLEGKTVDRYRVLQEIGRGGMAVVYLAERADGHFEQQVALKLIKRGVDTDEVVRRFERERQILARIRHPSIARLLDGGTTEQGRPFFAMERVEGEPIDRYCDGQRLSIDERLKLFLDVARAISHAHRNLVVHRDIKPSNILVTPAGEVKLLDFGIARLLQPHATDPRLTRTRERLLTPAFASPEQIRGAPVTTASDVYQLGVLLYLLLTGHSPHRAAQDDVDALAVAIVEQPPTMPSTAVRTTGSRTGVEVSPETVGRHRGTSPAALRRELAGDLDNIVLMALRKEPERRYASVELLIEDIERYLGGHPVSARPDTLSYRTTKFVKRHKLAVGLAASVVVLLAALAVTMTVQAGRTARERDRANREAAASEQVSEFLVDLFQVSDPGRAKGETVTAREILETGAERIGDELGSQPAVRAKLMDTMGRVYQNLGLFDSAQPLLEGALELRRETLGPASPDVAKSLNHVAWLLENRGDYDAAEPLYREALATMRTLHGEEHEHVADSLNNLALLLYRKGAFDEAEPLHRQALDMRRRLLDGDDPRIADSLSNLALLLGQRGDQDEAERLHREALELRRTALGEIHPHVATSLDNLGRVKFAKGEHAEAESLFNEGLAMRRKLYGDAHPEVAQSLNNLASVRFATGDLEGAEEMFRDLVAVDRELLGTDHPDYANGVNNLAFILVAQGKSEAAEPLYRESLAIFERALEPGHWHLALTRGNYGECLLDLGRTEEAEAMLLAAHAAMTDALGEDHQRTKKVAGLLATLYETKGMPQEAARYRSAESD